MNSGFKFQENTLLDLIICWDGQIQSNIWLIMQPTIIIKRKKTGEKHKDLQINVEWLQQKKAKLMPIEIGALATIPKYLEFYLNTISIDKHHRWSIAKCFTWNSLCSVMIILILLSNNICLSQVIGKDSIGEQQQKKIPNPI